MHFYASLRKLPKDIVALVAHHLEQFDDYGNFIEKEALSLINEVDLTKEGKRLKEFLCDGALNSIAIISGPAGSGKTTLVSDVLTHFMSKKDIEVILGAPTGRAAKVISSKAKIAASTIHRIIYSINEETDLKGNVVGITFRLKENDSKKQTIFFIDEASMISDTKKQEGLFLQNSLLDDLIEFVFTGNPTNKLVFIGDSFQLPPIGNQHSSALSLDVLKAKGFDVKNIKLETIHRQFLGSAILENASQIRSFIKNSSDDFSFFEPIWNEGEFEFCADFQTAINGYVKELENSFIAPIFLAFSNYRVDKLNSLIRKKLDLNPSFPEIGERLMVIKNHYFKTSKRDNEFIANGETVELVSLDMNSLENYAGFNWIDASINYEDTKGNLKRYKHKIMLDLLISENSFVSPEKLKLLHILRRRTKHISVYDPYLNALHLKYSYAITGHKSQGGEWETVYLAIEKQKGATDQYLKWVYTVFTRAKSKLVLIKI